MNATSCGARRSGFTLVELLVVIGIIALLISILLPALGRARQQAITVQCSSNLRQLHLSFVRYADNNSGFFPAPWVGIATPTADNWLWQWPTVMGTYFRSNAKVMPAGFNPTGAQGDARDWANWANNVITTPSNAPVAYCPTILATGLRDVSTVPAFQATNYSYALNNGADDFQRLRNYVKPSRIKGGAFKPYLFDVCGEGARPYGPNSNINLARPWANFTNAESFSSAPHNGKSNYLFYDGHVETLIPRDLTPIQFDVNAK